MVRNRFVAILAWAGGLALLVVLLVAGSSWAGYTSNQLDTILWKMEKLGMNDNDSLTTDVCWASAGITSSTEVRTVRSQNETDASLAARHLQQIQAWQAEVIAAGATVVPCN